MLLVTSISAQMMMPLDCNQAPFGFQELCFQLQRLDAISRQQWTMQQQQPQMLMNAPSVPGEPWLSPAVPQQSFQPSAYDCMDLQCLCPYFRGRVANGGVCLLQSGAPLRIAVRKEIRQMTDDERGRYFRVLQTLKRNGDYDTFAATHRDVAEASGAHSGPGFLPWHREHLKRVEIAIRLLDPSLAIPYWDSVMDSYLPDPRDSILWSPMIFGENDQFGNVVNGPFAGFRTLEGRPTITRNLGAEGSLFREKDLNDVYEQTAVENVLSYTAPLQSCPYPVNFRALEYTHGRVHNWVGGDMKPIPRSANDPVFYSHHSFVDYIFEQWRQMRQNRWQREQMYPPDLEACENPQHFANAVMRPFFNFINRNGLSNAYTDNMYTYAPRPTCSVRDPSCGSGFLFCDFRNGRPHCVSKIKMNGLCRGFEGENACYGGVCANGFCRPGTFQASVPTMPAFPVHLPTKGNETKGGSKSASLPDRAGGHSRVSTFINTISGLVSQAAPASHQLSVPTMPSPVHLPTKGNETKGGSKSASLPDRAGGHSRVSTFINTISGLASQAAPASHQLPASTMPSPVHLPTKGDETKGGSKSASLPDRAGGHSRASTFINTISGLVLQTAPPSHQLKSAPATSGCFNDDPCCSLWAARGDCPKNEKFMKKFCKRSCGVCKSALSNRKGCFDRHISCPYFHNRGDCTRKRQWMAENCQFSCGWCNFSPQKLCARVARMSRM
ncbi:Putative tyrosinase-like protein tyr-1 [Toxocara canis]|nr:Putative tyrosinase-like protein tyr-1 [Toxocara canis]